MNDKKNIDRLFQEKFKDFDVHPNEIVWEKIRARQNKEEKRLFLLPFWYRIAGVAALTAIILGLGYSLNNTPEQNIIITNTNIKNKTEQHNQNRDFKTSTEKNTPHVTVVSEEKEIKKFNKKHGRNNPDYKTPIQNPSGSSFIKENTITTISSPTDLIKNNNSIIKTKVNSTKKNKVAEYTTTTKIDTALLKQKTTTKNTIVVDYPNQGTVSKKEDVPVFINPNEESDIISTENITNNKNLLGSGENIPTEENLYTKDTDNKKSIFDVINKEQKEEIVAETSSAKKWNIAPNIAPVYYNSIGNGSSIDSQFADNDKNGEVNMSYGVQVSYTINKKFSVRSGVNKVDLSYTTKDIGFVPSATGQNLQNVEYNSTATAIFIADIGNRPRNISESLDINRNAVDQTQNVGLLNQNIEYIEIPMEMKYALVDKKFGINMIGGISTLFLQNNEISIEAGDFETPIGEANNLNEVSFSGNIGLGVDYKLSEHLEINLEPIFKYQFNAFNETANNFKPYYFGIYTGLNIKF